MSDLFLSYHSADRGCVRELRELLTARGISTFLDKRDLTLGVPWPQELEKALERSYAVAVLLGREIGYWQQREINYALERQGREAASGRAFPVIPVLLPGAEGLPTGFLAQNSWVDLRTGLDDEEAASSLAKAVRRTAAEPADASPDRPVCPFKGLKAFQEEDAPLYFGREEAAEELLAAVLRHPVVTLVGASGSGKSSLARAGLLPRLRSQRPPDVLWDVVCFSPGNEPFYRLVKALVPLLKGEASALEAIQGAEELAERLSGGQGKLEHLVESCLEKSGGDRLLIVVDQLEELFTQKDTDPDVFLRALRSARARSRLSLLFTLRADFYERTLQLADGLGKELLAQVVNHPAMGRADLAQAIEGPLGKVGLGLEPGLLHRLLDDAGTEPGNLPLLELALTELWNERQNGALTHTGYEKIGGVAKGISRKADRFYEGLPPERQRAARRLFTRLVRISPPGEGARPARQRVKLKDLAAEAELPELAETLARQHRLLVLGGEGGAETVTLAHDALIQHWDRLRSWLVEDQELLLWRQRLQSSLTQWEAAGREEGALLHGALLSEAERWLRERPGELSAEQEKLIRDSASLRKRLREEEENRRQHDLEQKQARADEQSRRAEERGRANRRLKLALASLAVLLAVLVVLGLRLAVTQKAALRQSQRATARYLSSQIPAVFANRHQTALLLAIEAFRLTRSAGEPRFPPVEQALRQTLTVFGGSVLGSYPGPYRRIVASPDHTFVAGLGKDGKVRVWNLSSADPAKTEQVFDGMEGEPARFEISPDNRWLLLAAGDKRRLLLRRLDGRAEPREIRLQSPLVLAVFSADDRWLGLRATGEAFRVFDLAASGVPERQDDGQIVWSDPESRAEIRSGHWLVSGGDRFAHLSKGELHQETLGGHDDLVRVLGLGADERWLLSSGSAGRPPRLWDLRGDPATPAEPELASRKAPEPSVKKSVLSADRRWLAVGLPPSPNGSSAVQLWDLRAAPPVLRALRLHREGVSVVTFSPDSRLLVTGGKEGVIRLYRLQPAVDDQPVVLEPGGGEITAAAFSPDSRRLAVATGDRTVRLWPNPADLDRNIPPDRLLEGAAEPLTALAFGPGAWLAAGGREGTLYLWDQSLYPRTPIAVKKHSVAVHAVSFSGDGRWLTSTDEAGVLRWRMREDELERFACRTVGRNLSRKEWADYFPGEDYCRTCPELPAGD